MTHNELARISILFKVYYRNQKRIFSQPYCDCFWFLILRFRYTVSTLLYSHDLLKYTTTLFTKYFYLQVSQANDDSVVPSISLTISEIEEQNRVENLDSFVNSLKSVMFGFEHPILFQISISIIIAYDS